MINRKQNKCHLRVPSPSFYDWAIKTIDIGDASVVRLDTKIIETRRRGRRKEKKYAWFFFVLYAPKFAHHPLGKTKETRQGNCQINPIPEWLGGNKRTFPVTTIASDFLSFSHGPSFVSFGFFSWKFQIIIIIHFFLLLLLRIMLAPSVAAFNSAVVTARLFS